ncbi:hypothetical protein [Variovorax soli]|uniref:Signal recognition particle subunit FFH/SRP54 (Srp54) n=1 Tax=Variovorax soli TaxID=376815 RepID=A0ABU1N865_9BURK|nr:hypothetical protein [Variovorax soli]MDR6534632.1 hypothetical protein [Variovorax soli]
MRSFVALCVAVGISGCAAALSEQDHAAHHPAGASAPAVTPAQMDTRMKSMQEMHEKMMAAKTPQERQALMAEHMKSMQGGMAMMGQMKTPDAKDGDKSMSPEMMDKRMDMMEMMMQMMMEREAARTPAGK